MKNGFPPVTLVKTWLFILNSKENGFPTHQANIRATIIELFGSEEIAHIYVEHVSDGQLENHVA